MASTVNGARGSSGGPHSRQALYEQIKQSILNGEIGPDVPLVETTLAKRYKVSRTPIRETLTRLEQDGLVVRTDRGLIVRERSPEEILDIYEARIVLEANVSRVAASRRSQIDLINLKRVAEQLEQLDAPDELAMMAGNREFHQMVWRASHNEPLIDLLTRLDLHLARYPATTLSQPGRWEQANQEHRELIAAIEDQDGAKASQIATSHFTAARDLRLELWSQQGVG